MQLTRSVAPAVDLVTLAEAKAHLRVEHSAEDTLIQDYTTAAIELLDGRYGTLGRALVNQTWILKLPCFPASRVIELPLPPLVSVTDIKYNDTASAEQTMTATDYTVQADHFVGRIVLGSDKSWPSTDNEVDAVTITYVAGFGATSAAVPAAIKAAARVIIGELYANRGFSMAPDAVQSNAQKAVTALLRPYKVWCVA